MESESVSHSVISNSCDPVDCSLPDSSVHGILQERIPEWIAIPLARKPSQPGDQTHVFALAGRFLMSESQVKPICHGGNH